MALMKNPQLYSKIDKEDPEELIHRRAQFLIHRILERADSDWQQQQQRSRLVFLVRKRVFGIRVRVGKRLKRLRKSMMVSVRVTSGCVYKNLFCHIKSWKRFFGGHKRKISSLRPVFALQA